MSATELESARLVRAALGLIVEHIGTDPGSEGIPAILEDARGHVGRAIHHLEQSAPQWEPEPAESTEIPWSRVACGDSVQAPNGTWYAVDAVARIGERMRVHLLLDAARIESTPKASDPVPVRRGPAGQAMDIFTASGLELTLITSGVAA